MPELLALRPGEQVQGLLNGGAAQGEQIADSLQLGALLPGWPPAAVVRALQYHRRHTLHSHRGAAAVYHVTLGLDLDSRRTLGSFAYARPQIDTVEALVLC